MKKALIPAFLLVLGSTFLGATVLQEQVAWAAQSVNATIIGPLDADGNVKVHEQGTADVNVTNASLSVAPPRPVTAGGRTLGIGCPSQSTQPEPIVASALQIAWIGGGATTVELSLGGSLVTRFVGPGISGDTSSLVFSLDRPIAFNKIECFGTDGVIVSTIGNEP